MKTLLVTNGTVPLINHDATGAAVRLHRRSKPMTMKEAAKRMGISISYLCDLEMGRRNWTAELVRRYQEAVK